MVRISVRYVRLPIRQLPQFERTKSGAGIAEMTIEALIFDVDGTLAETEEAHRQAFNEVFAQWRLGWIWDEAIYRELLRTTGGKERIKSFQRDYLKVERLNDEEIRRLHVQKTTKYGEIIAGGGLSLRPGIETLMENARSLGQKLAVATTTTLENVDGLCRAIWKCGAGEKFDVIAAGDQVSAKKPAPDVYLLALNRLKLPPSACIAFEDSCAGVQSALAAGLTVLASPSRFTTTHDFKGAEAVSRTFEDFIDRLSSADLN